MSAAPNKNLFVKRVCLFMCAAGPSAVEGVEVGGWLLRTTGLCQSAPLSHSEPDNWRTEARVQSPLQFLSEEHTVSGVYVNLSSVSAKAWSHFQKVTTEIALILHDLMLWTNILLFVLSMNTQDQSLGDRKLNSGILGASVGNISVSGLRQNVTIFLRHTEPVPVSLLCRQILSYFLFF